MIIGTAGHIDHGKTALIKALTGVDADRLKEEKARGITIDLGYAYTPLPNGDVLGFIDVPGHEKLVHNMLAGATGIEAALLVIAADDGPMPQTREHLAILDLLGIARGAVALTKIDRVEPARAAAARAEITALLAGTPLAESPVFPVSAITGEGVAALGECLEDLAQQTPSHTPQGRFRLAVDRVFTLAGTGTVVTGTVFAGSVQVDEMVRIVPSGLAARVRGIHAQGRPAHIGHAGQRCALNLSGAQADTAHLRRGDWVVADASAQAVQRFDADIRLLASEGKPLKHWAPAHLHLGATDVLVRIALLEDETLAPGQRALAQIVTAKPICAAHGDRFILRDASATRTLGGGQVLDIDAPERHRRKPERLALLRALQCADPAAALAGLLARSPRGVDLARFACNWNLREDEMQATLAPAPAHRVQARDGHWAFAPEHWQALQTRLLDALGALHRTEPELLGPDRERLRRIALPALPHAAVFAALDALLSQHSIHQTGIHLHLPDHKVCLSPEEARLWSDIRVLLDAAPFQPPRVRDLARDLRHDEDAVRQLLKRVTRTGEAQRVAHDHYFTQTAVDALAAILRELAAAEGCARAAAFRDRIDTGRKLAIQILEYFDRIGYTRRIGDTHRLRAP